MKNNDKIKLLIISFITTVSFLFLVSKEDAALGILIFSLIQTIILLIIKPQIKTILLMIPIILLSSNYMLSANSIWNIANIFVIVILYATAVLSLCNNLKTKESLFGFIKNTIKKIVEPFNYFDLPFKWGSSLINFNKKLLKKLIIAISITLPIILIITKLLSSADMIFQESITKIFKNINLNPEIMLRLGISILIGIYIFGLLFSFYKPQREETKPNNKNTKQLDTLITNIVIGSILTIYTLFIIIQFKYLFTGSTLPYNLSYSEYARKGFFELLFLSGINIIIILILTIKSKTKTTKIFSLYLTTITIILLISSFYRMYLYTLDFGLTRLRILVLIFLIFEAIALIITYIYIIKPKFNIIVVYLLICLIYFITVNLIPIDRVIAKNQINRYFDNKRFHINYLTLLSLDAAPEMKRLINDKKFSKQIQKYFTKNIEKYNSDSIVNYNYSKSKAMTIYKQNRKGG